MAISPIRSTRTMHRALLPSAVVAAGTLAIGNMSAPLAAQDGHYWVNQYGSRGNLVGGLVVGTFVDLSATFYNPGAIAFVEQPSLLLTTDAWELQDYDFEDFNPDTLDLETRRLRPAPSIFAIQFKPKGKHRFAISTVTRTSFEFRADAQLFTEAGNSPPGDTVIAWSFENNVERRAVEAWPGFTWSFAPAPWVGVGATTYVGVRAHFGRDQVFAQLVDSAGGGTALRVIEEYSFWNVRLLWKLGVAFDFDPLTAGVTITTPGINLFGTGRVLTNDGKTSLPPSQPPTNQLEANFQERLPSTYNSPFSVAVGASYRLGKTTAYTTGEWFAEVPRYAALSPEPFVSQTSGDTIAFEINGVANSVFNWGVGAEQEFAERFHIYGAFFKDGSFAPAVDPSDIAISTWDILHVSGGAAFTFETLEVTLGLSYGWGSDQVERTVVLPGGNPISRVQYRSIKFLFGFAAAL